MIQYFVIFTLVIASFMISNQVYSEEEWKLYELNSIFDQPNKILKIPYKISNGQIQLIQIDSHKIGTITIEIQNNDDGKLELKIPKNLPFTNLPTDEGDFFVFIDGNEVKFENNYDDCFYNILIPFQKNNHKIELFASFLPSSSHPVMGLQVSEECINKTIFTKIPTPKKQLSNGILPTDVICKEEMKLIFKSTNDFPACVTTKTGEKLAQRGWGMPFILSDLNEKHTVETSWGVFETKYFIEGGTVKKIDFHEDTLSVDFLIESNDNGKLIWLIPKKLLEFSDGEIVIIGITETNFKKIILANEWAYIIEFPSTSEKISIVGFIWP